MNLPLHFSLAVLSLPNTYFSLSLTELCDRVHPTFQTVATELNVAVHRLASHHSDYTKQQRVMQAQLVTEINTKFAVLARDMQTFRLRLRRTVQQTTRQTLAAQLDVTSDLPRAQQLSATLDTLSQRTKRIEVN